jgi:putative selenate reductase FAD-binding subunit
VTVEDYIRGTGERLILAVHVPKSSGICRVKKVSRSAGSEPILHAAVCIDGTWGNVDTAVIALGGVAPPGTRLQEVESALLSGKLNSPEAVQAAAAAAVDPDGDRHGSAEYKRYITGVTVADCVADCMGVEG